MFFPLIETFFQIPLKLTKLTKNLSIVFNLFISLKIPFGDVKELKFFSIHVYDEIIL